MKGQKEDRRAESPLEAENVRGLRGSERMMEWGWRLLAGDDVAGV